MKSEEKQTKASSSPDVLRPIAESFVLSRRTATPLDTYPGVIPVDLSTAYQIQDQAIDLWSDSISGWKVGRIPPQLEGQFGSDRLAGPIFAGAVETVTGNNVPDMPIFRGGFAAVEAEFIAVVAADAPAGKREWSREEVAGMIAEVRIGLEVASSPLGAINDLGPAVTASDFGNNAGLIVGPAIADWAERDPETLSCKAYVEGTLVGEGGAYLLTGGIVRSVQFMLELAASRGRPLTRGSLIATGQTTGIHEVSVGQTARIVFDDDGELACRLVAAEGVA